MQDDLWFTAVFKSILDAVMPCLAFDPKLIPPASLTVRVTVSDGAVDVCRELILALILLLI